MAVDCCYLVGNFPAEGLPEGCIISLSHNSSTEVSRAGDHITVGATTGNVTLTGYASNSIYSGCPSKAGVQIQWVRKYDCVEDQLYFIWAGAGQSFIYGDINQSFDGNITLFESADVSYRILNVSSSSGPAALYTDTDQEDGYGLIYEGGPLEFNTETEDGCTFTNYGIGEGDWYLQNFSIELNPGALPVATYSFMFTMSNE